MYKKVKFYLLSLDYDYIKISTKGLYLDREDYICKISDEVFMCTSDGEIEPQNIDDVVDLIVGILENYIGDFRISFVRNDIVVFDDTMF